MSAILIACLVFFAVLSLFADSAEGARLSIKQLALEQVRSEDIQGEFCDGRCRSSDSCLVYLIDNFDQQVKTIPELAT